MQDSIYGGVIIVTWFHKELAQVTKSYYPTVILPVVFYGCEMWSLMLREEHRLKVFAKRVVKIIFGPKRDQVTGGWRKLHNEELHNLYSSPSIIRMIK
jgi:hypothetical protein